MDILTISYIIIFLLAFGAGAFFIYRFVSKKYLLETLKLRLLLVRLPQKVEDKEKTKEELKELNIFSQLLSELSNLKIPFGLEVAVHNIGEEIHFYLAVPEDKISFVMRQVQGLWNDAHIELTDDYNIFNNEGINQGAYLQQKMSSILPVRTYEEAQIDTFLPIISNLSKISAIGEGTAIQILARPAHKDFKKSVTGWIYELKQGKKLEDVIKGNRALPNLRDFKEALFPPEKKEEGPKPILEEETIKTLEKKIAKQIFYVNARLVVSAPSQSRADELLENMAGSFSQFEAPLRNSFRILKPKNYQKFFFEYIFRKFNNSQIMTLGSDELTSLFHFPTSSMETPKIKWLRSREAAPPTTLPLEGTYIGETSYRGEHRPVFVSEDDRRRHLYSIGQTGTGKTTFMKNMILDDIQKGKGVAVLDPHGDLIDDILSLMPESRFDDVIVFDPGDLERPLGLNMLEYDLAHPEEKTFIVNEMLSIFDKLYDLKATGGPMFEQYMRYALLLLMEDAAYEPATLMGVPKIFSDEEYRADKLSRCQNPVVKDYWEKEALKAGGDAALANMTPYITSKFNNFVANDYMRPIISQSKSAFRFRELMDGGKILLVNLSKGRIGDINANLLGMIITGKVLMAALSRFDIPQEQRRDFNLYIDEFQNFTTDSISTILSEARKYRLNLVIAHQFIAQLQEKIRDSVFGNVGSMVVFRIGAEDAEKIIKNFEPVFTKNDLINIDNLNAYAKLLIRGETTKPFNIRIPFAPKGDPNLTDVLKKLSRTRYGLKRT